SAAMGFFKYSWLDFLFTCLGLLVLLVDIVLDTLAIVTFYQEKAYMGLGLLLIFLLGSSFIVQVYSWLWYSDGSFKRETLVERCFSLKQLKLLHVLQLGIYFRLCESADFMLYLTKQNDSHTDFAVFLSHDLSLLRLIETFTESCPQLVLMVTIMLRRGTTMFLSVSHRTTLRGTWSVTMYHRSLRSFVLNKKQQNIASSVVYFAWNMFLVSSRLAALALFASVMPCFVFTHFFCSWLLLFFFVWRSKTDFMESPGGEWLYRATVGLIWYFNWFNVAEGRTKFRALLYHGYILGDVCLLCSLWCWKMISTECPYFEISQLHAIITAVGVVAVNVTGLFLKILYYNCFHPNLTKEELIGEMDTDSYSQTHVIIDSGPSPKHCNKRMRKLAENFYS
uniref:XK-related protein n=1 Tax=Mola mola TaxID=94237 RepID=A0A3Q3WZ83_MOLML